MPLSLADYQAAVPDLEFPTSPWRVGTCPVCLNHGMALKLIDTRGTLGISDFRMIYEPWCPGGCTAAQIESECEHRLAEGVLTEPKAA